MKKTLLWVLIPFVCLGLFISCNKDEPEPGEKTEDQNTSEEVDENTIWKYVVAATGASDAVYLLDTDDINGNNLSIIGNGIEVGSATAWVFHSGRYAYRLVYAQGSAGTGSSYYLNSKGELKERNIVFEITNRFTTYGPYGNYVITAASGATAHYDAEDTQNEYPQYGVTFTYIDVNKQTLNTKTIVTENMVDNNGEYYTVSGIVESNGRLFTALCPQGYSPYGVWKNRETIAANIEENHNEPVDSIITMTDGKYNAISTSMHPNKVWVAIYDNVNFDNPTIISDDRLSYATSRYRSQFYSMIAPDADGNVYVFSANNAAGNEGIFQSTKNSGVLRIKSGTKAFDADYYCDITELSGGRNIFKVWHISEDYFLMQMFADANVYSATNADTRRLAVFKAGDKSFTWVDSGLPAQNTISSFGSSPFFEDGLAYIPVVVNNGDDPAIYVINPLTASASKGINVIADKGISAIGKIHN